MNAAPIAQPLMAPECLRLLASAPMGRIAYTRNALPAVEPVRFALDSGHNLVNAARTASSGQSMLDPKAASQLMARLRDAATKRDPLEGLTNQERRILELIGEGLTNRQIGERMYLAEKTAP